MVAVSRTAPPPCPPRTITGGLSDETRPARLELKRQPRSVTLELIALMPPPFPPVPPDVHIGVPGPGSPPSPASLAVKTQLINSPDPPLRYTAPPEPPFAPHA